MDPYREQLLYTGDIRNSNVAAHEVFHLPYRVDVLMKSRSECG